MRISVFPLLLTAFVISPIGGLAESSHDDLAQRSSWTIPVASEVRSQIEAWFREHADSANAQQQFEQLWAQDELVSGDRLLDRVIHSAALVDPRIAQLLDTCQRPRASFQLADQPVLADEQIPNWIRQNLALYYAQWLTSQRYYNEAQELLQGLSAEQVCDPAALLFYQAVVHHRLLEKDACLTAVAKLMENEAAVPQRYLKLARLMEADLRPLEEDSLDEISRLMESIRVRLGHGRAGTRVRQEEDDVIAKLDKMIKNLEDQASQAAAAASASGSNAPSSPMQDSMPGGQSGPGNVDPKKLGARTDWGNLPPKEREEALQQLGKDLPSHYRDVIEEYFRKLARDGVEP